MNETIDILIAKVLTREASDPETRELDAWLNADSANRAYFQSMQRLFDHSSVSSQNISFDADAAWAKVQPELDAIKRGSTKRKSINHSAGFDFIRIAAMLVIFAGVGYAVYRILLPAPVEPVFVASNDQVKEFILPDSTGIVLNKNTQLAYSFSKNKRKVELKGEAYFELAEDPSRPFEVLAGGISIRDIGTSFNVKAIEGNDSIIVQVTEGEVILTSQSNKSLVLKKGEEALYLKSRDELIKAAVTDTNAIAYKTKIFVFDNATLEVVASKLNEVYGTSIIVAEAARSCRLTATFKDEQPETIVEIIAETLQLNVVQSGNNITLEGTGCDD